MIISHNIICNILFVALGTSSGVSAYPGETAVFYCNISTGSIEQFSMTYQWVRVELDGDTIPLTSDIGGSGSGSGSSVDNSNVLTIYNITFSDDAIGYYCTSNGYSNSEVAYLDGK